MGMQSIHWLQQQKVYCSQREQWMAEGQELESKQRLVAWSWESFLTRAFIIQALACTAFSCSQREFHGIIQPRSNISEIPPKLVDKRSERSALLRFFSFYCYMHTCCTNLCKPMKHTRAMSGINLTRNLTKLLSSLLLIIVSKVKTTLESFHCCKS